MRVSGIQIGFSACCCLTWPACSTAMPAGSAPSSGSPARPTRQGAVLVLSRPGRRSRRYCESAGWTAGCRCLPPSRTRWYSARLEQRFSWCPALRRGDRRTSGANVAHGLGHGLAGAAVAVWPAVALVGSYELLMMVIHGSQVPARGASETGRDADPLQRQAAELFARQLAADRVPSVRAIRAQCLRPAPGAAAAGLSHHRSCKTDGNSRRLSGGLRPTAERLEATAARK